MDTVKVFSFQRLRSALYFFFLLDLSSKGQHICVSLLKGFLADLKGNRLSKFFNRKIRSKVIEWNLRFEDPQTTE